MRGITDLEKEIMVAITESDFFENGLESVIWVDTIPTRLSGQALGGVLSNLVQMGFISVTEYDKGKMVLNLKDAGKKFLTENKIV